ncbi:MAG TPA: ABC transporter ATP-binding protein [Pantanalinema sp.]
MPPVVELDRVTKTYRMGANVVTALDSVCLSIEKGEFVALVGSSGSGKSTLLNLIGGLDHPTSGKLRLAGREIGKKSEPELTEFRRRHLGFVFQTFNLIPMLNAWENVAFPLELRDVPAAEARQRALEMLAKVGLSDHAGHRPDELSGGQQQRVAIARALVARPSLVLADEPTANLDSRTGAELVSLMRRLNEEQGITFVFATHDPGIMEQARRVVRIADGRLDAAPALA